jgi:hypothetical protein
MENKELFKIALKYIEKDYSSEQLRYGDDLYSASKGEREICLQYYESIVEQGTIWANEYLKLI